MRVGPLANIAPLLRSLGCDPRPIFSDCGFQIEKFNKVDHLVPFLQACRLLKQCADTANCEHFGLLLGQRSAPSSLGIAVFAARAAPTVEIALGSLVDNMDLHDKAATTYLDIGPQYTTLGYRIDHPGALAIAQINDLTATLMFQIMRLLCGQKWLPASVTLERYKPQDRTVFDSFFQSAIHFNSTGCTISFQNHWLHSVPPTSDVLLFRYLEQEARRIREPIRPEFNDRLPRIFRQAVMTDCFSSSEISAALGLQERTLQRRLKQLGTTFREQLDAARKDVSEELLEGTSLPVGEIATAVGYSDSSTFIRAFRRWSGTNPSEWRKANKPAHST